MDPNGLERGSGLLFEVLRFKPLNPDTLKPLTPKPLNPLNP